MRLRFDSFAPAAMSRGLQPARCIVNARFQQCAAGGTRLGWHVPARGHTGAGTQSFARQKVGKPVGYTRTIPQPFHSERMGHPGGPFDIGATLFRSSGPHGGPYGLTLRNVPGAWDAVFIAKRDQRPDEVHSRFVLGRGDQFLKEMRIEHRFVEYIPRSATRTLK